MSSDHFNNNNNDAGNKNTYAGLIQNALQVGTTATTNEKK